MKDILGGKMSKSTFNFIMAGVDEGWNVPIGETSLDDFMLPRILEYTPKEIEARLVGLDDKALAEMIALPSIFASEMKWDSEADVDYMTIRLGRVISIAKGPRNVEYQFCLDEDLGRIVVRGKQERKALADELGIPSWEFNRTHWAVKDSNYDSFVSVLRKWREEVQVAPPAAEPPKADVVAEKLVATSVEEFLSLVLGLKVREASEMYFRGHADGENHKLIPSALRKDKDGDFPYLTSESRIFSELECRHPLEFAGDRYTYEKLVRMQHFGLPTRLLDVTSNPLIALFFACSDRNDQLPGHVIIFQPKINEIEFYDSTVVSCISNLARLDYGLKEKLGLEKEPLEFAHSKPGQALITQIAAEKPHVESFDPRILQRIVFVRGQNSNPRISSQVGSFLLFGHNATLEENDRDLGVSRIIIENKSHIMAQLARLNIKESVVYPGLESSAREIAKTFAYLDPPPDATTAA
jgi:hypothetical protein